MKIHNADFILGASKEEHFPQHDLPEIAFAGRSNVGKSSLINSLVHRKNLARISSTPGKTSEINFFNVEDRWVLVDMPGFGFTKKGAKKREEWSELNFQYLHNRPNLKLVCCLIDSRHDPMKLDLALIEMLENNQQNYLIILTKCDKLKPKAVEERHKQITDFTAMCNHAVDVLPYSSVSGMGRSELFGVIKKHE